MRKLRVLIIICTLMPVMVFAQRWKTYRYEVNFGLGASNFLGDLGGANQIGTHYFRDLEFSETRLSANLGVRYKLNEYLALRANLAYGKVAGDDKLTKEFFRNYRNESFKSNIFEFNSTFE